MLLESIVSLPLLCEPFFSRRHISHIRNQDLGSSGINVTESELLDLDPGKGAGFAAPPQWARRKN